MSRGRLRCSNVGKALAQLQGSDSLAEPPLVMRLIG
jgi:hypothetical protein